MLYGIRSSKEDAQEFARDKSELLQRPIAIVKVTYGPQGKNDEFKVIDPDDLMMNQKHLLACPIPKKKGAFG